MFVHLDGRGIRVESKRGERVIGFNEELIIRNEGLPRRGRGPEKGDLYVRFEIEMPGASWAARADPEVSHYGFPWKQADDREQKSHFHRLYLN